MKKIIILIISLFFITGCNAKYEIVLKNDIIEESLNITALDNETYNDKLVNEYLNDYYKDSVLFVDRNNQLGDGSENVVNDNDLYNKSFSETEGFSLNHQYKDPLNLKNSSLIAVLFENVSVTRNQIMASEGKNIFDFYPLLDKITVSFKTDRVINETNCDYKKNNEYFWEIDRDNYYKKNIKINVSNEKAIYIDEETSDLIIKIVITALCVILISAILFILIKFLNSNKK